jgi:NO-binding membrane sensor protein with MHYT domain
MFQILSCLEAEHDWRLVALAFAVCVLASGVAISLFHRAKASHGGMSVVWLSLDAAAGGCGIWATHFIAVLAFDPGVDAGYDLRLTILSLIFAVIFTGVGFGIALVNVSRLAMVLGGAMIGAGIAAMHYTGMSALELPGHITWSIGLVVTSLVLGALFAGLALLVAATGDEIGHNMTAAALLAAAILFHHFSAMGAMAFVPDPTQQPGTLSISPASLSLLVAGAAAVILGMCLLAALSDRRSQEKLEQQKALLDVALNNMSQGLCMFDTEGRATLFNDNFAKIMGLPVSSLKSQSLLTILHARKTSGGFTGDPEEFFARIMTDICSGKSGYRITESSSGRALRIVEQPMQGGGWVATFEDITEWRDVQAKLSHMAHHDALTDLPNRTKFYQQLEQALRQTRRNGQTAVFYLDLDHFKEINDTGSRRW